jgi:hypothetical protein
MKSDQDQTHLNHLAIAHYIVGGVMVLFSCLPLIHVFVGLAFLTGGSDLFAHAQNPPPPVFGWLFLLAGLVFFVGAQTVSIAVILSGRFLKKRQHYLFSFIIGCLACMFFPFGTVLGVFTIIVLSRDAVKAKYDAIKYPPPEIPR